MPTFLSSLQPSEVPPKASSSGLGFWLAELGGRHRAEAGTAL